MGDSKFVITTEPKTFRFDLPKHAGIDLKHEIYSVIKLNKTLAEYTIKNKIRLFLSKYNHGNGIHEYEKQ